jgi:chitin disaccharide deacetylase
MKYLFFLLLILGFSMGGRTQTLAEKLGFSKTDRLLIVNCDDAGMCLAANKAEVEGQLKGLMTSGSVMVPCPQFDELIKLAKENPKLDLGIHLTHTAEWKGYKWRIVGNPEKEKGLSDPNGFMWSSVEEVYHNSTPLEVYYESKAQVKKALDAGLKPTHLDSHMDILLYSPPYVDVYLQLAVEYNLPVRMASQETLEELGQPDTRKKFTDRGILYPDNLIYEETDNYPADSIKYFWTGFIQNLKPGVTELYIHASVPDEELKSITDSWKARNAEYELFTNDEEFRNLVKNSGIILIGYKSLFDLQRKQKK